MSSGREGIADHKVRVVLIHHDDPERVAQARRTARAVAGLLARLGTVDSTEIRKQPAPVAISARALSIRLVRQWHLERRWARHLGVSRRWVLSVGLLVVRLAQLSSSQTRSAWSRRANIELALSAKHELAWRDAMEADVDFLVVLEDDASIHGGSEHQFAAVADHLAHVDHTFAYIDLAGGLSQRELRVAHLQRATGSGHLVRLERAAGNTACGYLMGREVVRLLAQMTITQPESARHPADWMINKFFIEHTSHPIECLHTQPPALDHGSMLGVVPSSTRGNQRTA
jgi:hypothetical protein